MFAVDGTLTLRGIGKPVTRPFTLAIDGNAAHMAGRVQPIRTDFGAGQVAGRPVNGSHRKSGSTST